MSYMFSSTLVGLTGLNSAQGCLKPGLSPDSFCFCNRNPSNLNFRLGPAKVPQPGVDLIDMPLTWLRGLHDHSRPEQSANLNSKACFCPAEFQVDRNGRGEQGKSGTRPRSGPLPCQIREYGHQRVHTAS
jgi:hypothetical protein